MALIKKSYNRKRLIKLGIAAVVIAVGGLVVMNIINSEPDINLTNSQIVKDKPIIKDLGEDILQSDLFKALEKHGELPVEKGIPGRRNPFKSFVK